MSFTLIAYGFNGTIVDTYDCAGGIKKSVNLFREKIKSEKIQAAGMSLRDNRKDKIIDFGIFTDIDGTEYVEMGRNKYHD